MGKSTIQSPFSMGFLCVELFLNLLGSARAGLEPGEEQKSWGDHGDRARHVGRYVASTGRIFDLLLRELNFFGNYIFVFLRELLTIIIWVCQKKFHL